MKRIPTTAVRTFGLALLIVLAAGLLVGCGDDGPRTRKLLVIGVDSADWRLWRPMMEEGRLPVLKQFMTEAAVGRMRTFYPLEKSPLLWASINTGMTPDIHGVAHFVKGSDQEPVRGSAWGAPALWDILGAADRSTSIVGMWTTYPARPINGVMVSDYLPYGRERARPMADLVYPDSLTARIIEQRVDPEAITEEMLTRFIDADKMALALEKYPTAISQLRDTWAGDLTYLAVNRLLAEGDPYDLFFVYLRGPDMISHHFYHYMEPDRSRLRVTPEEVEIFGQVVRRYYDWVDEAMAEILGWFPPDRQAVVVSDHGFFGPRSSGQKGAAEHSEWGVFAVRSPLYQAGAEFDYLHLLDICPTLLALVGLPPAHDMPGAVLAEALTPKGMEFVRRLEGRRIPSYQALKPVSGPEGERDASIDEELRQQLKSLGYIN